MANPPSDNDRVSLHLEQAGRDERAAELTGNVVSVLFINPWHAYQPGDRASFSLPLARALVSQGRAKPAE